MESESIAKKTVSLSISWPAGGVSAQPILAFDLTVHHELSQWSMANDNEETPRCEWWPVPALENPLNWHAHVAVRNGRIMIEGNQWGIAGRFPLHVKNWIQIPKIGRPSLATFSVKVVSAAQSYLRTIVVSQVMYLEKTGHCGSRLFHRLSSWKRQVTAEVLTVYPWHTDQRRMLKKL